MKFINAMDNMRLGHKVKRPNWVGYWELDMNDLMTINITYQYFKGERKDELQTIKLSESGDMFATLLHTQYDDWEIVEEIK